MMRRHLLFLYVLFSFSFLLTAENSQNPAVTVLKDDSIEVYEESYGFINSYPVREEGSPDEAEVLEFIERFALDRGFYAEYQTLDGREDMHSFSSNLLVRVAGAKDETLILAVPVDSYNKDEDRAVNPSVALAFLNEWKDRIPPLSLIFLFTSADIESREFLGSLSFISKATLPERTALLYLLMNNNATLPEIRGSTISRTSPGWYIETIRKDLENAGIYSTLDASGFLVNRAGLAVDSLPLGQYLREDIPSAALVSSGIDGPSLTGQSDQWLRFLHSLCASISQNSRRDWESNYVYWAWNKRVLFYLSERIVLFISLVIFSLALIIMLIQQRKIHLNFKKFRKHLWAIPVIVYLIFTFYMISTLFLEELLIMLQVQDIWQYYSIYFLLLKIANALFFSSLFINLLRGLPFPRTPHFYSYMAFAAGLINIVIISFLNISFTPVLMINQLFIFLFIFSRYKGVRRLAITLSMVPPLLLLSYLFNRDYPEVFRFFLLSRIKGNWFLSLFSLPVICMIMAQHSYHHHYERSRQEMKTAMVTLLEGILVLSMVIFSFQLAPYGHRDHQIVTLRDTQNLDTGTRELAISSEREMGDAVLRYRDREISIPPGVRNFSIQGEAEEDLFSVQWTVREFLDRRSVDLTINTKDDADEILLEARSDERLVLYESLYPYELSPDQKKARIFIGINPPSPLGISLIFSGESRPELNISILRDGSSYELHPEREGIEIKSRTIIRKSLRFDSLKESGSFPSAIPEQTDQ